MIWSGTRKKSAFPFSSIDLPVSRPLSTCKLDEIRFAWSSLELDWHEHVINSSSSEMRRDFDSPTSAKIVLYATASARADSASVRSLHFFASGASGLPLN